MPAAQLLENFGNAAQTQLQLHRKFDTDAGAILGVTMQPHRGPTMEWKNLENWKILGFRRTTSNLDGTRLKEKIKIATLLKVWQPT
jgi:hypothetical protein